MKNNSEVYRLDTQKFKQDLEDGMPLIPIDLPLSLSLLLSLFCLLLLVIISFLLFILGKQPTIQEFCSAVDKYATLNELLHRETILWYASPLSPFLSPPSSLSPSPPSLPSLLSPLSPLPFIQYIINTIIAVLGLPTLHIPKEEVEKYITNLPDWDKSLLDLVRHEFIFQSRRLVSFWQHVFGQGGQQQVEETEGLMLIVVMILAYVPLPLLLPSSFFYSLILFLVLFLFYLFIYSYSF